MPARKHIELPPELADIQIAWQPDVETTIRRGKTWLAEHIAAGRFPAPIRIGGRNAWPVSVIRDWASDPDGWPARNQNVEG